MDVKFSVRRVSIEINEDNLEKGALNVLKEIRPKWKPDYISFKVHLAVLLTDGITNKLVKCYLEDNPDDVVLVRVYGQKTDLLIDRKAETRNIILLHEANLAPQLYATFKNGLAYEYVPGVTLTPDTVTQPQVYSLVAAKMAQLHLVKPTTNTNATTAKTPMLWNKLQQFYNLVPDVFTNAKNQKRFEELNYSKQRLLQEIIYLKESLMKLNSPLVFAHNDLLLGNVIYNCEQNSVTFIDYEYADVNYQAYDIGNHFAEFAGVENVDHSRYPSKEFQYNWLRIYLQVYHKIDDITEEEIERLYVQVNRYALVAHLFWGIWALIQTEHSNIDFDYMQYAASRLNEYYSMKNKFLSI